MPTDAVAATQRKAGAWTSRRSGYALFTRETRAIVYNSQPRAIQRMLDFDYIVKRETPSVAAIVNSSGKGYYPAKFGHGDILIPVYPTFGQAARRHPGADVLINFASFRSAYETTHEALRHKQIRTAVVIAEGVPERQARDLARLARLKKKWLIGPATVGGIVAGCFKVGNSGGTIDNIIQCRMHRQGHVGFLSKSGGLSNEMYNVIARHTSGICEGIALGGDRFPGNTAAEHFARMNRNPQIALLVYLGETGGSDEYDIVRAVKKGLITKPVVAWVTGTCAPLFPGEAAFGHAGAVANSEDETAEAKNRALRDAGILVPSSFDELGDLIGSAYERLREQGVVKDVIEPKFPHVPVDFDEAIRSKMIRKMPSIISTISDDRGEELTYNGKPISTIVRKNYGVGGVISELWFKQRLPAYGTAFIETVLVLVADHGPAVSGAHNAIVAARAGKDLVSSLASGLLTIGPRFGGAIDNAARVFSKAYDAKLAPEDLVARFKKEGRPVPGIGHRVKSADNPDKRVELLREFVRKNFPASDILTYALAVEIVTTRKKNTLILNVDGAIGACFADLLRSCFTRQEANRYIGLGALNGLFVVGRSIGIIGHYLDQKRLGQPLYRHAADDIFYMSQVHPC